MAAGRALVVAAIGEFLTGLALLAAPAFVGRVLLGEDLVGTALPVARVAGVALVGLAIACWPGPPLAGMLAYSAGIAIYLAYLGLVGAASGTLLWPAVGVHVALTALFVRDMVRRSARGGAAAT